MAATTATAALDAEGVAYTVTEYDVVDTDGGFGDALVDATGLDPALAAKTLVAMVDGGPVVAVVPIAGELDLKALARAACGKRAAMATTDDAERWTGSVVGGIAPLGHRRALPVYVDASLLTSDVVHVSGGRRGLELTLSSHDLVRACAAVVATIAR